ncbi:MAG: YgiT-type zinc finger protein [bacterium]
MNNLKCPECKRDVIVGRVEMDYYLDKIRVVVKNVPARVCSGCGREFIEGVIAENLDRLVDRVVEDVNSFSKKLPILQDKMREIAIGV